MIEMPNPGDLLIAPPLIPDTRFRKSVMLVANDNHGGTFALCMNRPPNHTIEDLLIDTGFDTNINFPLSRGGPVSPTTIWMAHSLDWEIERTIQVNEQWAITSNISMYSHLADGDYPEHFRLMLGYTSWGPGQLKAELRGLPPWNHNHSWLVAESSTPGWVLEQPVEDVWLNSIELSSHSAVDAWL